jgi:hypothetical protein
LRSYLLKCDGAPCSYEIGYSFNNRNYGAECGYDPEWRKYGVGTVLMQLVVEDMFATDTPDTYDFGPVSESGDYKHHFSNDGYEEIDVLLYLRKPYPLLARSVQRALRRTSRITGNLLDALHLRTHVRNLLHKHTRT